MPAALCSQRTSWGLMKHTTPRQTAQMCHGHCQITANTPISIPNPKMVHGSNVAPGVVWTARCLHKKEGGAGLAVNPSSSLFQTPLQSAAPLIPVLYLEGAAQEPERGVWEGGQGPAGRGRPEPFAYSRTHVSPCLVADGVLSSQQHAREDDEGAQQVTSCGGRAR